MIENLHIRLDQPAIQLRRRKLLVSVFSLLSFLSLLSLVFGFIQHQASSRNSQIAKISDETNWAIGQSRELVSISSSRSLQILTDQEKILERELAKTKNKSVVIRLNQLLDLLKSSKENFGLIHNIGNPELFIDLALVRPDIFASQIILVGDRLLVLDQNNRRLFSISAENRDGDVIAAGDSLSNVISITADKQNAFLLFPHSVSILPLNSPNSPNSQISQAVSDPDQIWQNPVSLAVYAGNIYVLDQGNSEIYKYPALDEGFGSPARLNGLAFGGRRRWLAVGVTPDLSSAVSLSIDGDAWILHAGGNVSRFRQGSQISFAPSISLISPISHISLTPDNAWLLDPDSITALDRDSGGFVSQWQFSGIQAVDFAVSESENKIFLLESSKIYSINL